jgi:hypothetical protein
VCNRTLLGNEAVKNCYISQRMAANNLEQFVFNRTCAGHNQEMIEGEELNFSL